MKKQKLVIVLTIVMLIFTACSKGNSEKGFSDSQADILTLTKLQESGVDFSKEQLVDFQVSVDTEENGRRLQDRLAKESFKCSIRKDYEGSRWTTECSKEMFLEIDSIMNEQQLIDSISRKYNGYIDGWGVLVKPNKNNE
ncbi:hypothetical protein GC093_29910 [Paenibacillus sp. LMG 31456]|uniref:Regulator of ribonuclease activity B domain-containing protein n=1 Tax=Paenibacillus foliorum TaxID=2654974 RepID=A0A972GV26_9BACL|nr:ribonuclease E inhibitor RraB [Paenibacillus foliorum]NOU97414.1 hypothetical protein [Paenibacillus foliorum]